MREEDSVESSLKLNRNTTKSPWKGPCDVNLVCENKKVFKPHQLLFQFPALELGYFGIADETGRLPRLEPSVSRRRVAAKLHSCRADQEAQERVQSRVKFSALFSWHDFIQSV